MQSAGQFCELAERNETFNVEISFLFVETSWHELGELNLGRVVHRDVLTGVHLMPSERKAGHIDTQAGRHRKVAAGSAVVLAA